MNKLILPLLLFAFSSFGQGIKQNVLSTNSQGATLTNIVREMGYWKTNSANGGFTNINGAEGGVVTISTTGGSAITVDTSNSASIFLGRTTNVNKFSVAIDGNVNRLRGVAYTWPSTNSSADQVMASTAAGLLYWTNSLSSASAQLNTFYVNVVWQPSSITNGFTFPFVQKNVQNNTFTNTFVPLGSMSGGTLTNFTLWAFNSSTVAALGAGTNVTIVIYTNQVPSNWTNVYQASFGPMTNFTQTFVLPTGATNQVHFQLLTNTNITQNISFNWTVDVLK